MAERETFCKLTKTQFVAVVIALWFSTLFMLAFGNYRVTQIAQEQERQVDSLCVRGSILNALVVSAAELVEAQPRTPERQRFIQDARAYHSRLQIEALYGRPCKTESP